jgi:hypothetical protein
MTTDTSEKGLETLIVRSLIDKAGYVAVIRTTTTATRRS